MKRKRLTILLLVLLILWFLALVWAWWTETEGFQSEGLPREYSRSGLPRALAEAAPVPLNLEPRAYLPLVASNPISLAYGRYGLAGTDPSGSLFHDAWYYWDAGAVDADIRRARMLYCATDYGLRNQAITDTAKADFEAGIRGRVWLVNNEPDSHWGQECGMGLIDGAYVYQRPRAMAHNHAAAYDSVKANDPHAVVFAGGILGIGIPEVHEELSGRWWWREFVDELTVIGRLDTIEGVAIHGYPGWARYCPEEDRIEDWCMAITIGALEDWHADLHVGLGLGDRPLWITETGCACFDETTLEENAEHCMRPLLEWFEGQSDYGALFWFIPYSTNWSQTSLLYFDQGYTLTPLGVVWQETVTGG